MKNESVRNFAVPYSMYKLHNTQIRTGQKFSAQTLDQHSHAFICLFENILWHSYGAYYRQSTALRMSFPLPEIKRTFCSSIPQMICINQSWIVSNMRG